MTRPRETCRHGHPWENLYIDARGTQQCRTCRLEQQQRFRERNPGYMTEKSREFRERHPGYMTEKSRERRARLAQHDRR